MCTDYDRRSQGLLKENPGENNLLESGKRKGEEVRAGTLTD